MKSNDQFNPPRWAQRFLEWYCKPELLEDLQGDLNEYFYRNIKTKSPARTKLIYILDVLKFLRLYTIRKPEFINLLINWIMIGSYIKTSGRSIVRNKLFSAINIIGLAISMSVGLLLIGVLVDMYSYDKFNENHARIYRVISNRQFQGDNDNNFMATSSLRTANAIKESFTGVEAVAALHRNFGGTVSFGEKILPLNGLWANEALFKVFTFPLLEGNMETALKLPFSIVLTETSARKIFGNESAMGKNLVLNNDKAYTVTGIMNDVPKFSHMHFDMLGSLSTREITEKDNENELDWGNIWNVWTYVLLPENANPDDYKTKFYELSKAEDPAIKDSHIELALQPLDDIMMGQRLGNQMGATMGSTLIWVFTGLSFVVILSACFNYTNLSVARSLRRSREVGIRKVIGALRSHVVGQFIVEAVLIALLSLAVAFLLFLLIRPYFINIHSDLQKLLVLELSPVLVMCFIGFAVFIGIIAGFFPALFFAKINAIQVLKDMSGMRLFQNVTLRKSLIVFQYSISIMLITGTVIMFQQYKHYMAFDLGFSTRNMLNIKLQGNKAEILKKELNELPEVNGVSESLMITSVGSYMATMVINPTNPEDTVQVAYNLVDENYIPLHDHQLLAGTNFSAKADDATESEVIINQQLLKRFNLANQNPTQAIGEFINVDGKELKIVGVMKDFQYGQANNNVGTNEVMLRYATNNAQYLNVKIESTDLPATYGKIESIWKKVDSTHPFEGKFYDDQLEESFRGISASVKLAGFIAFLAICIASMGLFGMVVFTTETRLKEISIRKVLGASEGKLIYLLGKGFMILMAVATTIALPLTYLFFDKVMLRQMANHAPLSFAGGAIAVLSVMSIAVFVIGSQTFKVARTNPAEVLKSE